jgi:hypothetical protein
MEPRRYRGKGFLRIRAPRLFSLLVLLPLEVEPIVPQLLRLVRLIESSFSLGLFCVGL